MDRIKSLPNLLIVGAAKSGTTSLHNYLSQHSDIFMCNPKEPHYLINKEIGINRIKIGISDFEQYKTLFAKGLSYKYRGESSVMYLMYPEIVIPKIKKLLGDQTRIIIMLRNPVDRAYSGFQHVKRFNIDENKIDFNSAWDICEERYWQNMHVTPASRYKQLGLYFRQVKSYLESLEHVHIVIYDDFKKDFQLEMNKIFNFLNVDLMKVNNSMQHMVGGWEWKNNQAKRIMMRPNLLKSLIKKLIPSSKFRRVIRSFIIKSQSVEIKNMNRETREMLNEFYKEDVSKLSRLLNRNLNHWTK